MKSKISPVVLNWLFLSGCGFCGDRKLNFIANFSPSNNINNMNFLARSAALGWLMIG